MLEKNMGNKDRVIRFILVIAVSMIAIYFRIYALLILSGLLLFTILTSFCWTYKLFKISTCKTDIKK
jgi:hypothetical protein